MYFNNIILFEIAISPLTSINAQFKIIKPSDLLIKKKRSNT